jgi:transcriptional regulator with XRE-family HTH domain
LVALRKRAGLTQAQVARAANCSLAFIGQLEAGVLPRRSEVLPRVIAVLNDASPAGEPGSVTTSAGVGDGRESP